MDAPILVIVNVPCASGVQAAEIDNEGGAVVSVTVGVIVAAGDWQNADPVAVPMLPPPEASSSRVP